MSIAASAGITALSPLATASRIRIASSVVANARAASWTKTIFTSLEIAASAKFTESLRNIPPVITVALSPTNARY
ncbi:unannotated protein [freshwater metagenome]|uniref:Unannotated protein n=1 Tax=freshwater metagenome TaxID=449393 RepID=A0A6J6G3T0_9ZZZZ